MKIINRVLPSIIVACTCYISTIASAKEGQLAVKTGEKIAFMGDSITQAGNRKNGYITLVMEALRKEGLQLTHVPAGKSGNKSNDMLGRLEKSVLSKKPDWMLLSCGVNDVWHYTLRLGKSTFKGVSLEDYKKKYP